MPTITDEINARMIAQAGESLKLIANFGTGVDNIDVTSALAARHHRHQHARRPHRGHRRHDDGAHPLHRPPAGRGLARHPRRPLARLVADLDARAPHHRQAARHRRHGPHRPGGGARRARAFGLSIHYHNRRRVSPQIEEALEATYWDSLDQMLARMDFISINCPHTPATYHLLSARRLKYLRPEAILVNTARGEVVDENALIRMLEADEIAGAGLDVFEQEPNVSEKLVELARSGKVTLLPHMGSATHEGRNDMGEKVIVNIKTFMDGHRPPDRVLPGML